MTPISENMDTDPDAFFPRIDYLSTRFLKKANIKLGILRLDQIHPVVSGNKWYKLKYNIQAAKAGKKRRILTFGGGYSNHLIATAYAARQAGLSSVGIVRGLHKPGRLTDTLKACVGQGMLLRRVSREIYAQKSTVTFWNTLQQEFPDAWIVPEGGHNSQGRKGAAEIAAFIPEQAHLICLPVGSGTTFAGLRNSLPPRQQMVGFVPMKNGAYLYPSIRQQLHSVADDSWILDDRFHFGGFARHTPGLISFMNNFYQMGNIPLDFVYTAKMMYGQWQRIQTEKPLEGMHIIALHTGGLQGNQSIRDLLIY